MTEAKPLTPQWQPIKTNQEMGPMVILADTIHGWVWPGYKTSPTQWAWANDALCSPTHWMPLPEPPK